MSLTVEFIDATVTFEEICKLQQEHRIRFRENPQVQPNGNVGFYIHYAQMPGYVKQMPKLPKELEVRFTYRENVRDGGKLREGVYEYGESIELMTVQHIKDKDLKEKVSKVEIIGNDLSKIKDAFLHLRSGALRPTQDWSSPGTIEAATSEPALPPTAATTAATAA